MIEKEELKARLRRIRLVAIDLDGTLTDGSTFYTKEGPFMKRFNVRDRIGISLLNKAGFITAIVTAESSTLIEKRAEHLKVHHLLMNCTAKAEDIRRLASELHLSLDEIAYIGDDVNDERAMRIVGFACCPNDAHPIILQIAHYVLPFAGGRGCVRALCDTILLEHGLPLNPEEPW